MSQPEWCRYCSVSIGMMCRKGTGFCSEKCQEDYEAGRDDGFGKRS